MTQDDIILIADASGLSFYGMGKDRNKFLHYLEAFANLVAKHEREACETAVEDIVKAALEQSAQRKPLTNKEIWQMVNDCTIGNDLHADKFARAIEQTHNIKD